MSLEHLCELLKYAAKRMMGCAGVSCSPMSDNQCTLTKLRIVLQSEPFIHPVDLKAFPDYRMYVVQPMDLTTIQNNIRNNLYGSTVAFMADAKWILHNSIIYNSCTSKHFPSLATLLIVTNCNIIHCRSVQVNNSC